MWRPYEGTRQIWTPPGVQLFNITSTPEGALTSEWRTMTPDSRLRCKVTLLFSPIGGTPIPIDLTAFGATLYLYEEENDYTGPSGSMIPSVALEGTASAPTALPKNPLLWGYSKEFVTAGDAIHGVLTLNPTGSVTHGQWVAQARWQPDGQRLPDAEWDEVKRFCNMMVAGGNQTG
jgi:hypothetical protein